MLADKLDLNPDLDLPVDELDLDPDLLSDELDLDLKFGS